MAFIRTVEDFICEMCGAEVKGNGYTNHCPKCLWSKHVDKDPGDRKAFCQYPMEPIAVEGSTGSRYRIRHRCIQCHFERVTTVQDTDDREKIIALAKKSHQSNSGE